MDESNALVFPQFRLKEDNVQQSKQPYLDN